MNLISNLPLLTLLFFYILAFLLGLFHMRREKEKLKNLYPKYKPYLLGLISAIFILSIIIIYLTAKYVPWVQYVFIANIIFIIYFAIFNRKKDISWRQHRMLFYNFLLIPMFYLSSILFKNPYILLLTIPILLYTLLEFRFASFDEKNNTIWWK